MLGSPRRPLPFRELRPAVRSARAGRAAQALQAVRAVRAGGLLLMGLLAPLPLSAACTGSDLRQELPAAQRAEIAAEMAATPYARGLSWQAVRGERRLRIIGTMHLNDPRHAALVRHMDPAIRQADAMLVEMTNADKVKMQRRLAATPELVYITDGKTLIDRLSDKEWQQVAELARGAGVPPFMAAKMRPWFLSMSLSVPQCARDTPALSNGLDAQLLTLAETAGIPAVSLEDPLTVFATLNSDPLEQQVRELRSYLAMMQVGADEFFTMVETYFDGSPHEFSLMQLQEFLSADLAVPGAERKAQVDELMTALLDDRNRAWVPVIEGTEGRALVVAVGAAHLPGKTGLLALLEAEGYTISEVPL